MKRAVFTLWDDGIVGNEYRLLHEGPWMKRPGGVQLKKGIEVTLSAGLETLGVLCHAVDPLVEPRKRKYFEEKSLLALNLIKQGEEVMAVITGEVEVDVEAAIDGPVAEHTSARKSAIDDLGSVPEGALVPEQLRMQGFVYKRSRMVRDYVVHRASGRCEYCREQGFLMANGSRYIEAHHILGLGANGPDTVANVIGLCPGHHREAHFGEKALSLNEAFKTIVDGL